MNQTYDVVGSGEGLSGLLTCILLANKGFSCLWADTSPMHEGCSALDDIPLFITSSFFDRGIKPILGSVDTHIVDAIRATKIDLIQSIMPGRRTDIIPERLFGDMSLPKRHMHKYLGILSRSMTSGSAIFRESRRRVPKMEPYENIIVTAMGRTGKSNYLGYLRYMTSLMGMYVTGYGELKEILGSYLKSARGEYISTQEAGLVYDNRNISGLQMNGSMIKARYYLSDDEISNNANQEGFCLYATCELKDEVIPVGMGELLFVSPPEDLGYPIVIRVLRGEPNARLWIMTRIKGDDHPLTSRLELLSWASGMILKRLRRIVPFMNDFFVSFDMVDPYGKDNKVRPWFRYSETMRAPFVFSCKHYIRPVERLYISDRMNASWIDSEGELLWGICIANEILRDLNRSDRISKTLV